MVPSDLVFLSYVRTLQDPLKSSYKQGLPICPQIVLSSVLVSFSVQMRFRNYDFLYTNKLPDSLSVISGVVFHRLSLQTLL